MKVSCVSLVEFRKIWERDEPFFSSWFVPALIKKIYKTNF